MEIFSSTTDLCFGSKSFKILELSEKKIEDLKIYLHVIVILF